MVFDWMRQPNKYNDNIYLCGNPNRRNSDNQMFTGAANTNTQLPPGLSNLKIIPKITIKEYLWIFDIYNKEKNGLLALEDLRRFLIGTY